MMVESYNGYYNENTSVSSAFTPVVVNSYSRLHAYPRTFLTQTCNVTGDGC